VYGYTTANRDPAGDISHKPAITACHIPLKTEVTVTQPWRYGAACDIFNAVAFIWSMTGRILRWAAESTKSMKQKKNNLLSHVSN